MSDQAGAAAAGGAAGAPQGDFGQGFGGRGRGRRGGRGRGRRGDGEREGGDRRGRGRGRRGRRGGRDGEKTEWVPVTKLGRLVQAGKIAHLEDIYTFALPIKEYQIIDHFLPSEPAPGILKDEVMKITPVQKQTAAGQRTRFKAWIIVGDGNGHIGLGEKCAREVATAIRGAIIAAKLGLVPVRRGYWGQVFGEPHTVPAKVTGKCGSVRFHIIPAPRGTGIVAAPVSKKVLQFAGLKDCYTGSTGSTRTLGNFVKATFNAVKNTYSFLSPDLWEPTDFTKEPFSKDPYQANTDFLHDNVVERQVKKAERGQ